MQVNMHKVVIKILQGSVVTQTVLSGQTMSLAYCQRMSTDEIPWWASGASLRKRRFKHMALQAQHTLEEERVSTTMTIIAIKNYSFIIKSLFTYK